MDPRSICNPRCSKSTWSCFMAKTIGFPVFLVRAGGIKATFLRGRYVFGERGYLMESHWSEDDPIQSPSFLGKARHVFRCYLSFGEAELS